MGADLFINTWYTPTRIPAEAILEQDEYRARTRDLLTHASLDDLLALAEDFAYSLTFTLDGTETSEITEEQQATLIADMTDYLASGYEHLHTAMRGSHRYIDFRNIGELSVWMTGGLSWGDDPWEGFSALNATVHGATHYIPGMGELTPWIINVERDDRHENSASPQAVGLVTGHASSILVHSALTHPDDAVRIEIAANENVRFTAEELQSLASDPCTEVREHASRRLVALAEGKQ